jgi:hypothetical protein
MPAWRRSRELETSLNEDYATINVLRRDELLMADCPAPATAEP